MRINNRLADGQAEPEAGIGAGTRFVRAIKALEDVGKVFGCDAYAGVGDEHNRGTGITVCADVNLAAGLWRKAD